MRLLPFALLWLGTSCFYPVPKEGDHGDGGSLGDFDAGADIDADPACAGQLGDPITDLSTLPVCCQERGGEAHCLGDDKVPDDLRQYFDSCAGGGWCIPDAWITTGGQVPPRHCTSFGGPGRCLSKCIPRVDLSLFADVCSGDQLCAPCTNPQTGEPTGVCDIDTTGQCMDDPMNPMDPMDPPPCDDLATCTYDEGCPPFIDPTMLPSCAPDAHCLAISLLMASDPTLVDTLAPCPDPTTRCVPDEYLLTGGRYIPRTCHSVDNAEGRCQSLAIPAVAAQDGFVPQDICEPGQLCSPCYNPVNGEETGACTLQCDTGPVDPPHIFAGCCEGRGSCIPKDLVSEATADNLGDDNCNDGLDGDPYLCVASEILLGETPAACAADNWLSGDYTGVCLTCMEFGLAGLAISQGNCLDNYDCVPCISPQDGTPTGAPGCPP